MQSNSLKGSPKSSFTDLREIPAELKNRKVPFYPSRYPSNNATSSLDLEKIHFIIKELPEKSKTMFLNIVTCYREAMNSAKTREEQTAIRQIFVKTVTHVDQELNQNSKIQTVSIINDSFVKSLTNKLAKEVKDPILHFLDSLLRVKSKSNESQSNDLEIISKMRGFFMSKDKTPAKLLIKCAMLADSDMSIEPAPTRSIDLDSRVEVAPRENNEDNILPHNKFSAKISPHKKASILNILRYYRQIMNSVNNQSLQNQLKDNFVLILSLENNLKDNFAMILNLEKQIESLINGEKGSITLCNLVSGLFDLKASENISELNDLTYIATHSTGSSGKTNSIDYLLECLKLSNIALGIKDHEQEVTNENLKLPVFSGKILSDNNQL